MLRSDAGIVQPGRNGVGQGNLSVLVLQDIAAGSVQDTQPAHLRIGEPGGMLLAFDAAAPGLHAEQTNPRIHHKRVENADRVAAAAHTGHNNVRQLPRTHGRVQHLSAGLPPDHGLQVAHHDRKRMGT